MTFREFIKLYNSGEIERFAEWRAYDMLKLATVKNARKALKTLGYLDTSNLGFEQAAHDFGLPHVTGAKHVLGVWYAFVKVSTGQQIRGLTKKEGQGNDD